MIYFGKATVVFLFSIYFAMLLSAQIATANELGLSQSQVDSLLSVNSTSEPKKQASQKIIKVNPGDTAHGQGTFVWRGGNRYVGEIVNGHRSGWGTFTYANGNKYVGQFVKNVETGKGTFTWASGKVKSGFWLEGKYLGNSEDASRQVKAALAVIEKVKVVAVTKAFTPQQTVTPKKQKASPPKVAEKPKYKKVRLRNHNTGEARYMHWDWSVYNTIKKDADSIGRLAAKCMSFDNKGGFDGANGWSSAELYEATSYSYEFKFKWYFETRYITVYKFKNYATCTGEYDSREKTFRVDL